MKIIIGLSLLAVLNFSAYGQTTPETGKGPLEVPGGTEDSLHSRRNIFSTSIYQGKLKLLPAAVLTLYRDDAQAKRHYRTGQILQPVAPLVSVAGVVLSYVALKGKSGTYNGFYNGKPVSAVYTARSRPKLAAGLGLFVAGIALVEFSSELVAKSARGYNLRHEGQLVSQERPTLHFGVTPSRNLGLFARF